MEGRALAISVDVDKTFKPGLIRLDLAGIIEKGTSFQLLFLKI